MKVTNQYNHLVEMVAHARILAANADDKGIIENANEIKRMGLEMAETLGVEKRLFDEDTIWKYKMLSKQLQI